MPFEDASLKPIIWKSILEMPSRSMMSLSISPMTPSAKVDSVPYSRPLTKAFPSDAFFLALSRLSAVTGIGESWSGRWFLSSGSTRSPTSGVFRERPRRILSLIILLNRYDWYACTNIMSRFWGSVLRAPM